MPSAILHLPDCFVTLVSSFLLFLSLSLSFIFFFLCFANTTILSHLVCPSFRSRLFYKTILLLHSNDTVKVLF
jgi:hypothetical protein